jgi:hypothetical protein
MKEQRLLFVYNANSDLFSAVSDFAHKILSPSTYQCHLCALTHSNFSEKQEWKTFIKTLPVKSIFLHKNEFAKQYKMDIVLPAIFFLSDGSIKEMIPKQQLESCQSLQELKTLVIQKLEDYVQHHHSHLQ